MPAQLSGGQQQRVAVARALVKRPGGAAARRAARRARPEAAPAPADRAHPDPPRRRHDVRLRHARPGGGDVDGRPHRRDERRPHRAARHADGDLQASGLALRRRLHRRLELLRRDRRRRRGDTRRRHARPVHARAERAGDADGAARVDPPRAAARRRCRARVLHTSFLGSYVRVAVETAAARRAGDGRAARRGRGAGSRRRGRALVDGRRRASRSSAERSDRRLGASADAARAAAARADRLARSRRTAGSRRRSSCSACFFLVPLGIIVCYSFWETVNYAVVHHWTLDNYHYFFSVPTYVSTMWATLWVSVLATAIAIGMAFPFAYWLSRYVPKRLRTPLLVLVIVPFWTSYLLRVYSWLTILGDQGVLNRFLQWTGHHEPPDRRLPLRPAGRDPRARLPLLPVRRADAVLVDRAVRLGPAARRDGPRRLAADGDLRASSCRRSGPGSSRRSSSSSSRCSAST